jgi:hypothetical protein
MLGKVISLFGAKPTPAPKAAAQLAMPLFPTTTAPLPERVVARWGALFPDQPALRFVEGAGAGAAAEYEAGGVRLLTVHIPNSIPTDEVRLALRASWMWQEPDDAVRTYASHSVVMGTGAGGNVVVDAWNVARMSAAMLEAGDGVALYWGNGRQVHTKGVAVKMARSTETVPVPLWVGVTLSGESARGPFDAATHGLESLGHKELEVRGTRMGIGDLRMTLLDLAAYVLERGPVLLDGQTFGPDADSRWSIRHKKSKLVDGRQAIVLGIPCSRAPPARARGGLSE